MVRATVEGGEPLYGLAQGVVAFGLMLGITVSALPLVTGHAKEKNEKRYVGGSEGELEDNVRWSVMSVTSCLPYLNYLVRASIECLKLQLLYIQSIFVV